MYISAGIPGTGIYAIHHYRSSLGEHPKAAGKVGVSPLRLPFVCRPSA